VRLLVGLVAVLVLAGCGTMAGRSGAPAAPSAPLAEAPPVQALDEAPPEEVQRMLDEEFAPLPADFGQSATTTALTSTLRFSSRVDYLAVGGGTASTTTLAELATLRAEIEAQRATIESAPGSPPRLVARLPLAGGGNALFVIWHNRDGLLCTYTQVADTQGGGGGGPGGPCASPDQGGPRCAALCLGSNGTGSSLADETWVLTGTVAADADALDVTTADGTTTEYPLTGPLLDGGDLRVFMLELGKLDWRKLTLLRAGQVVDETALPALAAASEDCMAKLGPMPPPTAPPASGPVAPTAEMKAWNASLQACLTASGALPAFPAPTP
jgi:hypothetical protein